MRKQETAQNDLNFQLYERAARLTVRVTMTCPIDASANTAPRCCRPLRRSPLCALSSLRALPRIVLNLMSNFTHCSHNLSSLFRTLLFLLCRFLLRRDFPSHPTSSQQPIDRPQPEHMYPFVQYLIQSSWIQSLLYNRIPVSFASIISI